jgi:FtsP/CotA-like multicopper oxidase with cupredoxin domain
MQVTRRETIVAGTAVAILAGIGISPASADPLPHDAFADRELRLSISDGFTRQTWFYAGQVWSETRDTLVFHEDETIRITIANDQRGDRVIALGEDQMIRVKQGEVRSVVLRIASLRTFSIAVADQPMFSRTVQVRANYGAHANVA